MSFLSKRKYLLIGLLSLSLSGTACIDTGEENQQSNQDVNQDTNQVPDDVVEISGTISQNQTWSGNILVTGDVTVRDGAEITIEAGTRIYVKADVLLEFGWNSNAYSIFADGTAEEPIVFLGETEDPGFWKGLIFRANGTSNSRLNFVEVHHAGGDQAALTQEAGFTVSNITVADSGDVGVRASNFRRGSENLTVTGSARSAVVLTNEVGLANFPYGGDLTGNGNDQIVVDFSNMTMEVNVEDPGVPFFLAEGLSTRAGTEFNVSEGVTFLVGVDQIVEFGWNSNNTAIDLQGTEAAPIIFEGVEAEAGSWRGVTVRGNVATSSNINHVVVRHGGTSSNAAVVIESGLRIQTLTVDESFHTGFRLAAVGLRSGSSDINIINTEGRAAHIAFKAIGTMPAGLYEGNSTNFIDVSGTLDIDATIRPLGAPFRIIEDVTTRGAEVVIEAGTDIYFSADSSIEFGWNSNGGTLTAVGTAANPIRFTSEDQTAGYWDGVILNGSMTSNSTIEYAEFHNAKQALRLGSSINVQNCTFTNYETLAIRAGSATDVAALLANNTFDGSGTNDVSP